MCCDVIKTLTIRSETLYSTSHSQLSFGIPSCLYADCITSQTLWAISTKTSSSSVLHLPRNPWFPRSDCSELSASRATGLISHYTAQVRWTDCVGLWVDVRQVPVHTDEKEFNFWHVHFFVTQRQLGLFIFSPLFANVMCSSLSVPNLSPGRAALKGTWVQIDFSLLKCKRKKRKLTFQCNLQWR